MMQRLSFAIPILAGSLWVVVFRLVCKLEFTAETNKNGHLEIEVPPDSYTLSANTEEGLWAPETNTSVRKHACVRRFSAAH
jgi:hypothetical protein